MTVRVPPRTVTAVQAPALAVVRGAVLVLVLDQAGGCVLGRLDCGCSENKLRMEVFDGAPRSGLKILMQLCA